jgi:hypothetical protein
MSLIDKNADKMPEGDYLQMCRIMKELHQSEKTLLVTPDVVGEDFIMTSDALNHCHKWITATNALHDVDDDEELAHPGLNAFLQDLHAEWSATDDGNSMNDIIEKFRDEFITDRTKHNLPEETYRKVYEFYTQLWAQTELV